MKKIVIKHNSGLHQIIGETDVQPPDLLDGKGEGIFNLVQLVKNKYYLYKPVMGPAETMANFRGDGTFKKDQR